MNEPTIGDKVAIAILAIVVLTGAMFFATGCTFDGAETYDETIQQARRATVAQAGTVERMVGLEVMDDTPSKTDLGAGDAAVRVWKENPFTSQISTGPVIFAGDPEHLLAGAYRGWMTYLSAEQNLYNKDALWVFYRGSGASGLARHDPLTGYPIARDGATVVGDMHPELAALMVEAMALHAASGDRMRDTTGGLMATHETHLVDFGAGYVAEDILTPQLAAAVNVGGPEIITGAFIPLE